MLLKEKNLINLSIVVDNLSTLWASTFSLVISWFVKKNICFNTMLQQNSCQWFNVHMHWTLWKTARQRNSARWRSGRGYRLLLGQTVQFVISCNIRDKIVGSWRIACRRYVAHLYISIFPVGDSLQLFRRLLILVRVGNEHLFWGYDNFSHFIVYLW